MKLSTTLALLGVMLGYGAGCGGGGPTRIRSALSTDWQDDNGQGARAIQAKLLAVNVPIGVAAAVGVVEGGLVGVPLSGGSAWSYTHAIDARPHLAGSVVVGTGGGELFALDATSGRQLWIKPSAGELHGAGDDGTTTVVSLGAVGEPGSVILAVLHDGTVLRQLVTSSGKPASNAEICCSGGERSDQSRYVARIV